jgi:hypothetical protein
LRIKNYDSFVVFVADDALVLDHHPYRDRHLILAVLTRGSGVQRGVLRRARGGKTPPAAAAQILSVVHLSLVQRPHAELATFENLELITSSYTLARDLARSAAGAVVAELLLTFCPPAEPAERAFRLGVAALEALLTGMDTDLVIAYTEYWLLALGGVLPPPENAPTPLADNEKAFLTLCRNHPLAEIGTAVPFAISGWLDRLVREEAERPLRALTFLRRYT